MSAEEELLMLYKIQTERTLKAAAKEHPLPAVYYHHYLTSSSKTFPMIGHDCLYYNDPNKVLEEIINLINEKPLMAVGVVRTEGEYRLVVATTETENMSRI